MEPREEDPAIARDPAAPPPLPRASPPPPRWIAVIRDAAVIYALGRGAPLVLMVVTTMYRAWQPLAAETLASTMVVTAIVAQTLGFFMAGVFEAKRRWSHLLIVSVFAWILGQLIGKRDFFGSFFEVHTWASTYFRVAVAMIVGGALSCLVRRRGARE